MKLLRRDSLVSRVACCETCVRIRVAAHRALRERRDNRRTAYTMSTSHVRVWRIKNTHFWDCLGSSGRRSQ
eukprot:5708618-Prymnesium_polylepis.1